MYAEWAPPPALAGRIVCLWSRSTRVDSSALVVPDGCVDLIQGPGRLFVAGPDTGPHPAALAAGDALYGVRFRPGTVGGLFGVPVEELRDLRVPLADLPHSGLSGFGSTGSGRPGSDQPGFGLSDPALTASAPPGDLRRGADGLAEALAVRLREAPAPDPAATAMAVALREGGRVGRVAADLGLSERHLHRRCRAAFGYGPKTLQRVMRFQRALRLARTGRSLAEVAVASGYADQAHMANEVRRLAGVPLGALLADRAAAA